MALSHAILVSLLDCPSSGYDLAKRFDGSVGFFWDASHQQIYRELAKLEAANHITAETIEQDARPNKKLYSVTESGKTFLMEWLDQSVSLCPIKDDLLVKLYGGYLIEPDAMVKELRQQRKLHQTRLVEYQAIEDRFFPDVEALSQKGTYQYLTLRNGIQFEQGWLKWCDEAIATLQSFVESPE
ncbi:PadR family transcriptional regulator [Oscillatoria sp. CS-180]|uniref:PadR family transcriptional regulator n=1 Tax=Oscillatoria sp. CS-180 TaxID=3021720 RepID=UPI00232BD6D6|nr:PadR family transcriptional regulator [Oscillatoria sp. CS-180]MDB9524984.1 PadR family transcriptional regulator [Oscillatoria sp. CS-180]